MNFRKERTMSRMSWLHAVLSEKASELGYKSIEDAVADGYDIVGEELLKTAEKALQEEKDEQLNKLDEVIAYLKEECSDEEGSEQTYLIGMLRDVEKYIKERS